MFRQRGKILSLLARHTTLESPCKVQLSSRGVGGALRCHHQASRVRAAWTIRFPSQYSVVPCTRHLLRFAIQVGRGLLPRSSSLQPSRKAILALASDWGWRNQSWSLLCVQSCFLVGLDLRCCCDFHLAAFSLTRQLSFEHLPGSGSECR